MTDPVPAPRDDQLLDDLATLKRCPEHGIPDCSPLLNGCSWPSDPRCEAAHRVGDEIARLRRALAKGWEETVASDKARAIKAEIRTEGIETVLRRLDRAHARLIAGVTPSHPGWVDHPSEEYDALFSEWHAATRECRAQLGPNVHADPNVLEGAA